MADLIERATPVETVDVARLAAEVGMSEDETILDLLRRCWRAGLFFAVEDRKRDGAW